MAQTIKLTAEDGTPVEFVDEVIGSGAMKDVYFSPDKSYVVGFYRTALDATAMQRLERITGTYRKSIFEQAGGDYWKDLFCWPTKIVKWNGKVGIVCPAYHKHFFFPKTSRFAGKEKEGKWFASAKLRNKFLDAADKGNWLLHVGMCIKIARAVKRLHAAGLAHSDLSYKNVLVDPVTGSACVIDIDNTVNTQLHLNSPSQDIIKVYLYLFYLFLSLRFASSLFLAGITFCTLIDRITLCRLLLALEELIINI